VLLALLPGSYRTLFLVAFIPGLLSVALIYLVKEVRQPPGTGKRGSFFSFFGYWKDAAPDYKRLVRGLLAFSLFNSADVFLLLKTKEVTGSDTLTIGAYILYNVVFAAASYPLGALADRIGIRKVFSGGLLLFAGVYALFGLGNSTALLFAGFALYGIYAAATEGIAKAWISNLAPQQTGTAIGFYTSLESICALLASVIAGAVWSGFGSAAAFGLTALAALAVFFYFLSVRFTPATPHLAQ
jgi:MFS family permease